MKDFLTHLFDTLTQLATDAGLKLLYAALLLVLGLWLIRLMKRLVGKSCLFHKLPASYQSFLNSLLSIVLYATLLITLAMLLGVPATSFVTLLASAGVTIGLALQGSLSNVAGGVMILLFHPFRVGDFIQTPDASGTVMDITVFYTILRTPDNKQISLPNGALSNATVTNFSACETRRVDVAFTLPHGVDRTFVQDMMLQAALQHPNALADPAPFCRFTDYGPAGMQCTLRVWAKSEDYWDMYFDLMETIKAGLDERGISVPRQQVDVHLHQ